MRISDKETCSSSIKLCWEKKDKITFRERTEKDENTSNWVTTTKLESSNIFDFYYIEGDAFIKKLTKCDPAPENETEDEKKKRENKCVTPAVLKDFNYVMESDDSNWEFDQFYALSKTQKLKIEVKKIEKMNK